MKRIGSVVFLLPACPAQYHCEPFPQPDIIPWFFTRIMKYKLLIYRITVLSTFFSLSGGCAAPLSSRANAVELNTTVRGVDELLPKAYGPLDISDILAALPPAESDIERAKAEVRSRLRGAVALNERATVFALLDQLSPWAYDDEKDLEYWRLLGACAVAASPREGPPPNEAYVRKIAATTVAALEALEPSVNRDPRSETLISDISAWRGMEKSIQWSREHRNTWDGSPGTSKERGLAAAIQYLELDWDRTHHEVRRKALSLLCRAARDGEADALWRLSAYYAQGIQFHETGDRVPYYIHGSSGALPPDASADELRSAARLLRAAAARGYVRGFLGLADAYHARGVDMEQARPSCFGRLDLGDNLDVAMMCVKFALRTARSDAEREEIRDYCRSIPELFLGVHGQYRRYAWLTFLDSLGMSEWTVRLAIAYRDGDGVQRDDSKFVALMKKAARAGNASAKQSLFERHLSW